MPIAMNRSTAHGLAGAGALLSAVSLRHRRTCCAPATLDGGLGKSGAEALGVLAIVVVVLAVAAGWSARAHRPLRPLAAAALAVVVLVKLVSPPDAVTALGPSTGDELGAELAEAFASAFTTDLHYAPAWGAWLAAIGAGAALAGTTWAALAARSP
jgi:hypothetical protein